MIPLVGRPDQVTRVNECVFLCLMWIMRAQVAQFLFARINEHLVHVLIVSQQV